MNKIRIFFSSCVMLCLNFVSYNSYAIDLGLDENQSIAPVFYDDFISNIPDELKVIIFSFLEVDDLISLSRVSKYWRMLANDAITERLIDNVIVGRVGVGKSAFAYLLAGKTLIETEENAFVCKEPLDNITIFHAYCNNPDQVCILPESPSGRIVDCPGFDNDDPNTLANIYNALISLNNRKLRIFFVVPHIDCTEIWQRDLTKALNKVIEFFPNITQLKQALFLIVSGGKETPEPGYLQTIISFAKNGQNGFDNDGIGLELINHFIKHPERVGYFWAPEETGVYKVSPSLNTVINSTNYLRDNIIISDKNHPATDKK